MKQENIDTLNALIDSGAFSGVVSICNENEIIYQNASGYRDVANQLKNNTETKFALASGAKTFTSIAILLLQEQGKLNIDDKISKYIGDRFPNYHKDVTIKHLLSHSSGIPDYLDEEKDEDLSHIPWYKMVNPIDYLAYFPETKMDFLPGDKFKYNNGAFVLLAYIVDQITGDFYGFVDGYLQKAGLYNTGFYMFDSLPSNTALGYITKEDGTLKTNIYELPIRGSGDGGIYSTLSDISLFWKKLFQHEILNSKTMECFVTPQMNVKNNNYYGLGAWIRKSDSLHTIDMLGQDQGVSFLSSYNVNTKEIYTVISNNERDAWKVLEIIEK